MSVSSRREKYIEFFKGNNFLCDMIFFGRFNGEIVLPSDCVAYRVFEIVDRVDEAGEVLRSYRVDEDAVYLR